MSRPALVTAASTESSLARSASSSRSQEARQRSCQSPVIWGGSEK